MRRGNGDGSIYKLSGKRRNPYAVRVTVGWTTEGKQQFKYVGFYSTKTDAKKALNEYLLAPEKAKLERITLKGVFDKMIETSKFSEGTRKQYEGGFKKFDHLHNREIASIELHELEQLLIEQTPSVQARIKKTLSNCYKYALKHDYVNKNLAEFLDVDSVKSKERNVYKIHEINELWANLGKQYFDDIPLILLYTGLRISELLELKTSDVDLEAKTMRVTRSKTAAGVRVVPIHNKILPLIETRFSGKNTHLITHNDKRVAYSTFLREFWLQKYIPHECRHTFITYLSKQCDDIVAIKKIVGHATNDITEHYTHHSIEELQEAINKLEYK